MCCSAPISASARSAYDFDFSLLWVTLSTLLVWAGPAQVILISTLGGGAQLIEVAVAVGLSGVRLLPMVVSLLPVLRGPQTRTCAICCCRRISPRSACGWNRCGSRRRCRCERRIAFCNGLACGYMMSAMIATVAGYYLAARLPVLLTAALLFLTPMSFLVSIARNSQPAGRPARACARADDRAGAGLSGTSSSTCMWAGIVGGTLAYLAHRVRESLR